jgi:cytochrome b involved in lipid metabolism
VIHGKVYSVTPYLNDHPGGIEIITDLAGQNATEAYDDVGHSEEAHQILAKYLIGDVDNSAPVPPTTSASVPPVAAAYVAAVSTPPTKPKPATIDVAPAAPVATKKKPVDPPAASDDSSTLVLVGGAVVALAALGFFMYKRKA